jgi:hypothetical protein
MLGELYDRMAKVEPTVQKVQAQVDGIRSMIETVETPGGDEVPMQLNLPDTTKIGDSTSASMAIPSSYFLDLRAHNDSTTVRHIIVDWITLHDNSSPVKTLALASVDVTNTITTAGSIANGRDQVADFTASTWIYFYIIYNTSTGVIASLSSASATTPTLPSGYDYFVRVSSSYLSATTLIMVDAQLNESIWIPKLILTNGNPGAIDTWENLDISTCVPPTAKAVFGNFGLTAVPTGKCGMAVASDTSGSDASYSTFSGVNDIVGYEPYGATYFLIPLTTPQQISWKVSRDEAVYGIRILGYEDDL